MRPERRSSAGRWAAALMRAYQVMVSPFLGRNCRFIPSCSEYAREAFLEHGVWGGAWLAMRRLGRCHPLHSPGYDPVPEVEGPK